MDNRQGRLYAVVEIVFVVDFLLHFFIEFPAEGGKTLNEDIKPIRDLLKIGKRYLSTTFLLDLLACTPFNFFITPKLTGDSTKKTYDYYYLIFLFKILRVDRLVQYFTP